jgi:hypothetical protein
LGQHTSRDDNWRNFAGHVLRSRPSHNLAGLTQHSTSARTAIRHTLGVAVGTTLSTGRLAEDSGIQDGFMALEVEGKGKVTKWLATCMFRCRSEHSRRIGEMPWSPGQHRPRADDMGQNIRGHANLSALSQQLAVARSVCLRRKIFLVVKREKTAVQNSRTRSGWLAIPPSASMHTSGDADEVGMWRTVQSKRRQAARKANEVADEGWAVDATAATSRRERGRR